VIPSMFDNQMRQQHEDAHRRRSEESRTRQEAQRRSQDALRTREEAMRKSQRDEAERQRQRWHLDEQRRSNRAVAQHQSQFADSGRVRLTEFMEGQRADAGWSRPQHDLTDGEEGSSPSALHGIVRWIVGLALAGFGLYVAGYLFG
jgi:hypothetical protein